MSFFKRQTDFDLGELHIENIFITDFMPSASGTNVKVYLLGFLFSKAENTQFHYDNRTLATMLSLPLQDVHEAWRFWEKNGLIVKHVHEGSDDYDVEFLSLRALYIENNYNPKSIKTSSKGKAEPQSIVKLEEDRFQKLKKSVEQLIGHPLTYVESRDIADFYENYSKDPEFILRAFKYCYHERNIRTFKMVKNTISSWLDQGIHTLELLEKHLASTSARSMIYKEVLKLLGNAFRQANQGEKDLIDKWIDVYGFKPDDLYGIITDLSKKTLSISFNYIDKALTALFESQTLTYEAYMSRPAPEKNESKPASKRKNYTIEKENVYSDEELERLLLNKKK